MSHFGVYFEVRIFYSNFEDSYIDNEDGNKVDKVQSDCNLAGNGNLRQCTGAVDGVKVKVNKKKNASDELFMEQIVSECEKTMHSSQPSYLTFSQYDAMESDQKMCIHNRIRQWALKARESLPKDHGIFCLVVAHLLKNAHRYFDLE